jgi:nucleoside-diphosphate-sugar epimerase
VRRRWKWQALPDLPGLQHPRRNSRHPGVFARLTLIISVGPSMAKLIFGCGYLGRRVAERWLAAGEAVYAVTRSPERGAELASLGIQPIVGDVTGKTHLSLPPDVRTVLFAVGFDRSSGHSIHETYAGGIARAIEWTPESTERFIYISST